MIIKSIIRTNNNLPYEQSMLEKLRVKYFNTPLTATSEEWKEYAIRIKKDHPILYILLETIPDIFDSLILDNYKNIGYWLSYRLNPNHWKYWIIKPKKLSIGYHDARDLILHTNFQILSDFMEDQLGDNSRVDWDYNETTRHIYSEMIALYEYWNNHSKLWNGYYESDTGSKEELEKQENEMLKRLIDIRLWLWD